MSVERPDKARTRNFSLPASSVEAGFEDREGDRNGSLLDRRHAIMDAKNFAEYLRKLCSAFASIQLD
jgi:hypothetical protein